MFRSLVISLVNGRKTVSCADCYFRGLLKETDSGHETKQIISTKEIQFMLAQAGMCGFTGTLHHSAQGESWIKRRDILCSDGMYTTVSACSLLCSCLCIHRFS